MYQGAFHAACSGMETHNQSSIGTKFTLVHLWRYFNVPYLLSTFVKALPDDISAGQFWEAFLWHIKLWKLHVVYRFITIQPLYPRGYLITSVNVILLLITHGWICTYKDTMKWDARIFFAWLKASLSTFTKALVKRRFSGCKRRWTTCQHMPHPGAERRLSHDTCNFGLNHGPP